jgi:hypothetical protein
MRQALRHIIMVRATDFKISAVHVVVVTPVGGFNTAALLGSVLGRFASRYDGIPQVLPLPDEVPPEINRVTLTSKDSNWGLFAGPKQIVSAWKVSSEIAESPDRIVEIASQCSEVVSEYIRKHSIRAGRLGFVVHRVCAHQSPQQVLIDRFCNIESRDESSEAAPFRRSTDFQIHNCKQYAIETFGHGLKINSWVRCKVVMLPPREGLLIEQDINTLAEEADERQFGAEEVDEFARMAATESNEIVNRYFPI